MEYIEAADFATLAHGTPIYTRRNSGFAKYIFEGLMRINNNSTYIVASDGSLFGTYHRFFLEEHLLEAQDEWRKNKNDNLEAQLRAAHQTVERIIRNLENVQDKNPRMHNAPTTGFHQRSWPDSYVFTRGA